MCCVGEYVATAKPEALTAEALSKMSGCDGRSCTARSSISFLMRKFGTNLFDAPDWAALVELTFFAYKRGRGAAENPYVVIGWLLSNHRSNDPGETAQFNVENEIDSPPLDPADRERDLSSRFDRDMYKPRLLGWRDKRKLRLRGRGKNIHQEVGRKTIRDVAWQVQVIVPDFPVLCMRGNPPG